MKQNHFMLSRFIFWSFSVQCSAQTDNLFSVEIPCDCLTRFPQLVVHYTFLIPPNTEHCLLSVDIPLWRRCRWLIWIANGFSAFGVIEIDPLSIASHNLVQKPLSLLPSKQNFADGFSPFNISWLQFIWDPFSFLVDLSQGFQTIGNNRLNTI